ncbi:hypothetical protein [Rubrivirga sp. IMCC45206]|uniref:hypothetical protein n=1 Tax=Rubrivirga sp. IMCC45206 TaxID=3391614 RepID=UPI00398FA730
MRLLTLFPLLALAACSPETCRVESAWYITVVGEDRDVSSLRQLAGPYAGRAPTGQPDPCVLPFCNVVGDSLYYIQRVTSFEDLLYDDLSDPEGGAESLLECDVVVTRDCVYDVGRLPNRLEAVDTCGPDYNASEYVSG